MRNKKEKRQKRQPSLYWQQFMLTAGLLLLTMVLLGVAFYAVSYNYAINENRDEMRNHANLVGHFSRDYLLGDSQNIGEQEDLRSMAGVAAEMSDVHFLICDAGGHVLLTSDEELVGRVVTLSDEVVRQISQEGGYEDHSTLGIYDTRQIVVGVPVKNGEQMIGIVLAVMDSSILTEMWQSFTGLFFVTSMIILMISFMATSLLSARQIRPIREMVKATRSYGSGEFDVRIPAEGMSEEFEELASSFNAMADSLAETERQRRDFIANVSHELKTPMTTIAGYTDGILDGTIPPAKEKQYLQIISDESRRLSRLVRRMLDISQIQSQEVKMEEFDICESMRLALLSMEQQILQRGLDVDADIPDDSVMVQGDNDLITQVVYNLLENATKFATPGSALYLGLHVNGDKALVTVRNEGHTIPPEEIPLLFERFHKSDKSRGVDKDGYGLGLYVVKTILAQHKEEITVTSENGVTAFSFTMKIAHGDNPPA